MKKRNFRFLTKIRLIYTFAILLSVASFGIFLHFSYIKDLQEATMESGQQICKELSINLNTYIVSMDDISKKILSDTSLRSLLRTVEQEIGNDTVFDQIRREREIATAITSAVSLSAFPSLNVYIYSANQEFCYIYNQGKSNFHKILSFSGNLEKLQRKQLLVYVDTGKDHPDDSTISFVRSIFDVSGNHYGFVEIQASLKSINRICDRDNISNIVILDSDDQLIYSYYPADEKTLQLVQTGISSGTGTADSHGDLLFYSEIDNIDATVCLIYSAKSFLAPISSIQRTTFAFLLCVVIFGLIVFYFLSKQLVKPLHELRDRVKEVTYENIGLEFQSGNNEIMDLKESFQAILSNLKMTTEHELELQQAESDARLAAMQDQISPHFIRNVLYSISITAKEGLSDKASLMCKQLADMLCYTVDSNNQGVTLEEEFGFLSNYLSLEKIYYEDFLEYTIHIEDAVKDIIIPRLSIQPFVENTIQHAFENCIPPHIIHVTGRLKDGEWIIEVEDNGNGFDPVEKEIILSKLESKIIKADFNRHKPTRNGIGIVNTFQRMKLFFDGNVNFSIICKEQEQGTIIRISGHRNEQT